MGLSETEVSDANATMRMLQKGSSNRMTGGTAMNEQSSRSHAIFTISLEQSNPNNGNQRRVIAIKKKSITNYITNYFYTK